MRMKNSSTIFQLSGLLVSAVVLVGCNTAGSGANSNVENTLNSGQQATNTQQEVASAAPIDRSNDPRAFCPKTVIRDGTESYREFDPPAENGAQAVGFQSTITEVARECNYSPTNLNIRVGLKGRAINGPSGRIGQFNVPVRVAVVDTAKNVQYSVLHQVPVTIPPGGSNTVFNFIDSNINLPVPEKPNLTIFVGFDEGPPQENATEEVN